MTELVVPISVGEVFERERLQHILPASASCAGSMYGKSVSLNTCRIRKSNHVGGVWCLCGISNESPDQYAEKVFRWISAEPERVIIQGISGAFAALPVNLC